MEITLSIASEQAQRIAIVAERRGVAIEEFIDQSIEESLSNAERFRAISDYLLEKNAELYRRLAK